MFYSYVLGFDIIVLAFSEFFAEQTLRDKRMHVSLGAKSLRACYRLRNVH